MNQLINNYINFPIQYTQHRRGCAVQSIQIILTGFDVANSAPLHPWTTQTLKNWSSPPSYCFDLPFKLSRVFFYFFIVLILHMHWKELSSPLFIVLILHMNWQELSSPLLLFEIACKLTRVIFSAFCSTTLTFGRVDNSIALHYIIKNFLSYN